MSKNRIFVLVYALTHLAMAFALERSLHSGDVQLYYRFALDTWQSITNFSAFSGGFAIEYPPLTAFFVTLPLAVAKVFGSQVEFSVWHLFFKSFYWLIDLSVMLVLLKYLAQNPLKKTDRWLCFASLYLVSLVLTPVYFDRLDVLLGALIFVALVSTSSASKNGVWPWFWLSVGVCFKLIPVLLGPLFLIYFIAQRQVQSNDLTLGRTVVAETVRAGAFCVAVCVALVLPFLLLWGADLFAFLGYHSERGLQVESAYSNLILLLHHLAGLPATVSFNYGSFNINAPLDEALLKLSSVLLLTVLFGCYGYAGLAFYRAGQAGKLDDRRNAIELLAALVCLLLLGAILTAKVFSPQYMLWLFPCYVLVGNRGRAATLFQVMLPLACALTTLIYPLTYGSDFVKDSLAWRQNGQTFWPAPTVLATVLLTLRNLVLVIAVVALLGVVRRHAWQAERPS
ncbi:hypothetical protein BGP77_15305 [Saccharospirillum sp. MSK14-1]|uniref:hypothetical protein n=1 Tax=Saccharospirillum sp. MSK14-1 TaxID=1897632 RepID=UPI000D3D22F3|nr:hypothetical protein [Saccharospirillum sp. MSK14-1]PTY37838.1 hypothetical protein BGP77_15305 [Saccharospirillum sp. MSK14-1]